ncbi:MAG TPA: ABC transporter permease [Aggregatilineaceae bacterium]|nr:ABC transporter permease [Aggregatilineaceae bacterium]
MRTIYRLIPNKTLREILLTVILAGILNAVAIGGHFWLDHWELLALTNLILLVVLAERVGELVPIRFKTLYDRILAFGFPALLLLGWEVLANTEVINPRWFPAPSSILDALWDLTVNYDRFNKSSLLGRPWLIPQEWDANGMAGVKLLMKESHVYATLSRVFLGFIFGSGPGIVIGMAMGMNATVRNMLDMTLSALYVLPKIAIFPIMMLLFPDPFGEGPKIAVVAISAFFLVTISTMTGVQQIDPVLIHAGKNYGANRWQMFRHVIIPGALPMIFSGLRLALGTGLIVIVAIEFVRAKIGVGHVILYYWEILSTAKMYAGLFVTMILGVLLTYGLQLIERWMIPWQRK